MSANPAEAARRLEIAKQECEAHEMLGEAALVALDLTEAFLILDITQRIVAEERIEPCRSFELIQRL